MATSKALPLLLECALDAIARQRAAGEPLDRVAAGVGKSHRLGPREREALGNLVFGWARHREGAERRIAEELKRVGGRALPLRERDLCALLMAQAAAGVEVDARARARLPDALANLVDDAALSGPGATLPAWLEARLRAERDDATALLEALARPAPVGLAVDARKASVDEAVAALVATGAAARPSPVVAGGIRVDGRVRLARLPTPLAGALWPMDEGSQVIVRALDAKPGERILDLCAGAGTKTRLLLARGATVVAADLGPARLAKAPTEAARVVTDGVRPGLRAGSFDKVLLDAPCSGTGTLRRAPDLAHRLREEQLDLLVQTQKSLLAAALTLTRPGGLVVYATCSLLRDENEAVVAAVLQRSPGVVRVPLSSLWGRDVSLDDEGRGELRLWPDRHGTDGFYVAALGVR